MLALYLINWGCNPFLSDSLKKSKQFNQSDITSGIAALTVMLSVDGPLWLIYIDGDGVKYGLWLRWLHCTFHRLGLRSLLPVTGIWAQIRTESVSGNLNEPLYTTTFYTATLAHSLHLSVLIPTSDFGPRLDSAGLAYKLHVNYSCIKN